MHLSLSTRLQLLLALCLLTTGHPAALVAAPCLAALVLLRAAARHHLAGPAGVPAPSATLEPAPAASAVRS